MFYLETNAISNINLLDCKDTLINQSYTSSFAILETLKGLNENTYSIKRRNIVLLKNSNISIMWETPIDRIIKCFPMLADMNSESYIEKLKYLYNLVYDNKKYESACMEFTRYANDTFFTIDKYYITYQKFILALFDENGIKEVIQNISIDPLGFTCGYLIENIKSLKDKNESALDEVFLSLYQTYNLKLNILFMVVRNYLNIYFNKTPDKNDFIDILHFSYLENNSCKFVTNDKKLIRISNLDRKIALTCDEYIDNNIRT